MTSSMMTFSIMPFRITTLSITTFSIMTFSITTSSIMTFSIMTFSIMIFSITTFSIMTFSIMTFSIMTFSIMTTLRNIICHYSKYHVFIAMQSVAKLNIVVLSGEAPWKRLKTILRSLTNVRASTLRKIVRFFFNTNSKNGLKKICEYPQSEKVPFMIFLLFLRLLGSIS